MRVQTLNVGSKGKRRELTDIIERGKVHILCVQGTRWKGSKAGNIGGTVKRFCHGTDRKRKRWG